MSKDIEVETAQWIYKQGKKRIRQSSLHNLSWTVQVFVSLLKERDNKLAEKLYQYYNSLLKSLGLSPGEPSK